MSGRTIISLEPRGLEGGASVKLEKSPVRIDNARVPFDFELDPDEQLDWAEAGAVEKQGKKIFVGFRDHKLTIDPSLFRQIVNEWPMTFTQPSFFSIRHDADSQNPNVR